MNNITEFISVLIQVMRAGYENLFIIYNKKRIRNYDNITQCYSSLKIWRKEKIVG
jgi:hypothetical protein